MDTLEDVLILGLVGAAFAVVVLLTGLRWHELNSNDMGTMSRQWLAEYIAQHSDV